MHLILFFLTLGGLMAFAMGRWASLGPILSVVVAVLGATSITALILSIIMQPKVRTMSLPELETFICVREAGRIEWPSIKARIQEGDVIRHSRTGKLSWRLRCGRESIDVVRVGKVVANLHSKMN